MSNNFLSGNKETGSLENHGMYEVYLRVVLREHKDTGLGIRPAHLMGAVFLGLLS